MSPLHITRWVALIGAFVVAMVSCTIVAAPAADAFTCSTRWGSKAKTSAPTTDRKIVRVRAGRHRCYDRLVIDLNGASTRTTGYDVRYIPIPPDRLPKGTGAVLWVVVKTPAFDSNGKPIYRPQDPLRLANVSGYSTFRQVIIGEAMGGLTMISLGVRARLPMRVFCLDSPGRGQRLVIDVAHQ
jgi:hypothetical protein